MFCTNLKQFTAIQVSTTICIVLMLVSLTKTYANQILQPSLCHSLMTNASCELGHMILMSTRVPILLSEYQILNEYSPSISICFQPYYQVSLRTYSRNYLCGNFGQTNIHMDTHTHGYPIYFIHHCGHTCL